jgi:NAD(P)-dependent dehydrogenase (short-subunit alcohol dehydrogenase family)
VKERHGRLDVLINNAAIDYDTWQRGTTHARMRQCCSLSVVVLGVKRATSAGPFSWGGVVVCAGAQPYLGARIGSGDEMIDRVWSPRGCGRSVYGGRPAPVGVGGGSIAGAGRKASV